MHQIDTKKIEVGFTDKYRMSFEGTGRDLEERKQSLKKFKNNYDKIDWNAK